MTVDINHLNQRIKELEAELDELKTARRVMERLQGTSKAAFELEGLDEGGVIDLSSIEVATGGGRSKPTLVDELKSVIDRLGEQEFTVNHVLAVMKATGKASDAKHFKNRLSMAIRKLRDEGYLDLTHEGSGNDPHKYKKSKAARAKDDEKELPEWLRDF